MYVYQIFINKILLNVHTFHDQNTIKFLYKYEILQRINTQSNSRVRKTSAIVICTQNHETLKYFIIVRNQLFVFSFINELANSKILSV